MLIGESLGRFLAERVFRPLGMADTAFDVVASKLDRLAVLFGLPDVFSPGVTGATIGQAIAARFNERLDVSDTHPTDPGEGFGRGGFGLFSTIGDYQRFA